jgi:hypothetical protein
MSGTRYLVLSIAYQFIAVVAATEAFQHPLFEQRVFIRSWASE